MSDKINSLKNQIAGVNTDAERHNKEEYFGMRDIPQSNRTSRRAYSDSEDGIDGYWEE